VRHEGVAWFGEQTPLVQIDVDDRAATTVIPDVVGELAQVAANRIRDAHLVPHLIGEGGTLADVRAQEPAAGQTVDRGTQVSFDRG
jgi:beta-lactam-binding protein with PASTA domain